MGAKTFEGDHHQHESTTGGAKPQSEGKPRGTHFAEDGDGDYGNDDDEDDRIQAGAVNDVKEQDSAKKKKRKKSKKSKPKQSSPPRVPLTNLFSSGVYPQGEVHVRTTKEEIRYNSRPPMDDDFLNNYRKAGEVHRQVRQWVHEVAKPGKSLNGIAEGIEDGVRALIGHQGLEPGDSLKAGMGFPTGLPLNNCAAHYTPNPGQKEIVLQVDDVMKVDFGVHINGWIVDSAFTVAFNPVYDNLLAAVKDATDTGIQNAGIDARICEISAAIQEAMESYEVELNGKTIPVKAVRNITGHNIKQYRIHGGKSIPFVKNDDETKMEEGEVFAIETFGTTGKGYLRDEPGIYGYGKVPNAHAPLNLASARSLLKTVGENFGTLVFCRRYLERLGVKKYLAGLNSLVSNGILDSYAPLSDVPGSYTAQFEHTILLRPDAKEVVSRGNDY